MNDLLYNCIANHFSYFLILLTGLDDATLYLYSYEERTVGKAEISGPSSQRVYTYWIPF